MAYVERPRRMALSPKQDIDMSFWTRNRAGEERYYHYHSQRGHDGQHQRDRVDP